MTLYRIEEQGVTPIDQTTFHQQGIRERQDIQRLLKGAISILDPGLMVIAEEYGRWEDSRRRIDLLCIDQDANLVVVEIKRTEDGGHMDLQAIRYAAMISAMTWDRAVDAHREYLKANSAEDPESAEDDMLRFLDWDAPQEEEFANDVRIYLVSAEFSREITTSVLWLNQHEIDIRCVRIRPHLLDGRVLLDVQQIVPLPEAADYQIQIREKASEKRKLRASNADFTRYDLTIDGTTIPNLPKRRLMYETVRACVAAGATPEQISEDLPRSMGRWLVVEGIHNAEAFADEAVKLKTARGGVYKLRRYYTDDTELFHANNKTYALSNQWARRAPEIARTLADRWLPGRVHISITT
ncbi:MAG: endonuclease NucS [Phycisphaerales bacterium]|nr:endonuclease NucS [Phycisphaerales bacterium]